MKRPEGPKARFALSACSVIAGFAITAGILSVVHGGFLTGDSGDSTAHGAAQTGRGASSSATPRRGGALSPAALDQQWLTYSDQSTCGEWAGGDGVTAIRLNSSQIAWFFADTILGPAGPTTGFSDLTGFLHNSVVMQTSAGNRTRLVTLTGGGGCATGSYSRPATSVLSAPTTAAGPQRYWDADGIKVGGTVVKFYNSYLLGPVPFVPTGTIIASFSAARLSAAGRNGADRGVIKAAVTSIPAYTPPAGGTPVLWGSALLKVGGTVYIYGWQSPSAASSQRQLYLARVRAARLADFAAWQFYADGQWSSSQSVARPIEPTTQNLYVPTGFSVVKVASRFWLIQAFGAGDPDIYAYPGPAPWGPFDAHHGVLLYRAPGIGLNAADAYRIMYEARAEPALSTSKTLVISYNVNSEAVSGACKSVSRITNAFLQPRFIAVPLSAFTGAKRNVQALVRAGNPRYPRLKHPTLWFDSLAYPGGCPPVPGVSRVTAHASAGRVRLTWPSEGLGMRYRIFLSSSAQGFGYVRTVSSSTTTITGLTSGQTYDFKVVPVGVQSRTGPAAYTSVLMP